MTFGELFLWSLRDSLLPKRLAGLAIIAAVGPALAILVKLLGSNDSGGGTYSIVMSVAVYSFALVLSGILAASTVVSGEVSGKTISFLLTRPVSRPKLFLAKWLGANVSVILAILISCTLTAFVCFGTKALSHQDYLRDVMVIPFAATCYNALFAMLSAILTRPALPAVFYCFGFETWIWTIPGEFPKLSLMTYVRTLSQHAAVGDSDAASEIMRALNPVVISTSTAWNTLIVVTILALAIGSFFFSRGEYVPKDETT